MRSDFYNLPWAAQQAIRRGERAASEAAGRARTVDEQQARIEHLSALLRELERTALRFRDAVRAYATAEEIDDADCDLLATLAKLKEMGNG